MYSLRYILRKILYSRYFIFFLNYIIIQNIITIGLLPVYSSWGISFSTLLWFGNLLFLPFLSLYLLVCLAIIFLFFFESFSWILVSFHNAIIDWWVWCLESLSCCIPYWKLCGVDYAPYSYFFYWGLVFFLFSFTREQYSVFFRAGLTSIMCAFSLIIFVSLPPLEKKIVDASGVIPEIYLLTKDSSVFILGKQKIKSIENKIEYNHVRNIRKYFGIVNPKIFFYNVFSKKRKIKVKK